MRRPDTDIDCVVLFSGGAVADPSRASRKSPVIGARWPRTGESTCRSVGRRRSEASRRLPGSPFCAAFVNLRVVQTAEKKQSGAYRPPYPRGRAGVPRGGSPHPRLCHPPGSLPVSARRRFGALATGRGGALVTTRSPGVRHCRLNARSRLPQVRGVPEGGWSATRAVRGFRQARSDHRRGAPAHERFGRPGMRMKNTAPARTSRTATFLVSTDHARL